MYFLMLALLGLVGAPMRPAHSVPQAAARSYRFDATASRLTWTGHAAVGTWAPSGTVRVLAGSLTAAGTTVRSGWVEVAMTTLQHENADLQQHLRGADFFAVDAFPKASFRLRAMHAGQAEGELTLKGVTRPVRFPLQVRAEGISLRLTGTATVDRTQFGITYNSASFFGNLGDYAIRDTFELAFDVVAVPE